MKSNTPLSLISCLCVLLIACGGCGSGSRSGSPNPSVPPLDLAEMKALKPPDAPGAAAFDAAIRELEGPGNTGGMANDAIGELAFRLSTIPALCAILERGDDQQVRLAFMGLRAVVEGVASVTWEQKQGPGFKLEDYRKVAIPVLAEPKHLAQIKTGLTRLPPPSRATFQSVVDAIKP